MGQVVAARWPLDEQWYRTEVIAITGPRSVAVIAMDSMLFLQLVI